MINGRTRRIVVIKDIPSNTIEEAILILKSEPVSNSDEKSMTSKKRDDKYLVKEAELIINNYIKECNTKGEPVKQEKPKPTQNKRKVNIAINTALVASIALLIFIIARII